MLSSILSDAPSDSISYEETGQAQHNSSIFAVLCSDPRNLAQACQKKGLIVRPIVYPTVPFGKERIRICLHSGNTKEEIDSLLDVIVRWVKEKQVAPRPRL